MHLSSARFDGHNSGPQRGNRVAVLTWSILSVVKNGQKISSWRRGPKLPGALPGALHAVGAECSLWRLLLAMGGGAIFVSFYFSMSEFYIPKH